MKYFNSLGFPPIYLLSAICYLYLLQFYCHAIFTSDPHDSATISTPPPLTRHMHLDRQSAYQQ
jgi:hypothetical protein